MDLPGLGGEVITSHAGEDNPTAEHELTANSEWRFEVSFDSAIQINLLSGTAELFGTELALERTYTFTGTKAALYSWHGCRFRVTGVPSSDYVAEETPMSSYANLHFGLENLRAEALSANSLGPRVMVVGPDSAGKTSLCKLLCAYATRSGRGPVAANLDPREGMLTVPDTVSAAALDADSVLDPEDGWGSSPITGPSAVPVKLPLVYFYGGEDPAERREVFKPLVSRLALAVLSRLEDDSAAKAAGCVVDTAGSMSSGRDGYEVVQHAVSAFQITVLAVLGSERLHSALQRLFPLSTHPHLTLLKLDRSGGCVDCDDAYLSALRRAQVRSYFFGRAALYPSSHISSAPPLNSSLASVLSPHTLFVSTDSLVLYRPAAPDNVVPDALLPGDADLDARAGAKGKAPAFERVEAPPPGELQGAVLAVMQAGADASWEHVRDSCVLGFLYVAEVDRERKRLRVLCPMGGKVPAKAMIWSGVEMDGLAAVMG